MTSVTVLNDILVSKISAGEVIESPASVVKELIENSLDANADSIRIDLKNAGKEMISIQDNGAGMLMDDLKMSVHRHATSKIRTLDDLNSIKTFGFRGEALAAISSVAKVKIFSAANDSGLGSFLEIAGGKLINHNQINFPKGTRVIVEDLFFNTPARLKFLKSDRSEIIKIFGLLDKIIFFHKRIRFNVVSNDKNIIYPAVDSFFGRISRILDDKLASNMIEVSKLSEDIKISGYISHPSVAKDRRYKQWVYVNGRPVFSFMINGAVYRGCSSFLMKGMHPLFFIMIDIAPELVDVNVHPSKHEVRFFNDALISTLLTEAVRNALSKNTKGALFTNKSAEYSSKVENQSAEHYILNESITSQSLTKPYTAYDPTDLSPPQNYFTKLHPLDKFHVKNLIKDDVPASLVKLPADVANYSASENSESVLEDTIKPRLPGIDDRKSKSGMSVLAQFQKYIIVQKNNDILFFDAHATHERILYENIKKEVLSKKTTSIRLLQPEIIKLGLYEVLILEANQEMWEKMGFEFRNLGDSDFSVNALPSFFKYKIADKISIKDIIHDVFAGLADFGSIDNLEKYYHNAFASFACHLAIRGEEKITQEEMNHLINSVVDLDIDLYCPHGRPIFKVFRGVDIDKMFKRLI